MTYSAIAAKPSVGKAGTRAELAMVGSPSSVSTPPVVYFYVQSAPSGSAVRTLDDLEVLNDFNAGKYSTYSGPLPLGAERKDLRLAIIPNGAEFTPDVPGRYVLVAYDITLYKHVPHYGGHVPGAGELAEVDNETAALPAYAGGTSTAPTVTLDYWVEESATRTIGQAPDTATIAIVTFDNELDRLVEPSARVKLTPSQSALAKQAVNASDVRAALNTIRGATAGALYDALTMSTIATLILKWNAHLALAATFLTHQAADGTNTLTGSTPTDLATAITRLNDLRTKYEAHRATTGTVHNIADATYVVTAPACTDFATARTLWLDLFSVVNAHAVDPSPVHWDVSSTPVDGQAKQWLEAPLPGDIPHLCRQVDALRTIYRDHISKATNAKPHVVADTDNALSAVVLTTPTETANALNALAFSIEHHAGNLKPDETAPTTAWHTAKTLITIPRCNAGDWESIERTAEACLIEMEAHAVNKDVHGAPTWGSLRSDAFFSDSFMARLQKAWRRAVSIGATTTVPTNTNGAASALKAKGWK